MFDLPPTEPLGDKPVMDTTASLLLNHADKLRAGGEETLAAALEEAVELYKNEGRVKAKEILESRLPDYEHWENPAFWPARFACGWFNYYDS